jgi:hypothetical protein
MNWGLLRRLTLFAAFICLSGLGTAAWAEELRTMDYVVFKEGQVHVVREGESTILEKPLELTQQLTVLTNGTIKVAGGQEKKLPPGRKLTLDGFWLNDDGMLAQFPPHYVLKDRVAYFVKEGIFKKLDHEVVFSTGNRLEPDGTVLTTSGKMIRLQDGQGLTAEGASLPALDHIMMIQGKLVLQKDGSIIGLPAGVMGMSDGTKVTPTGLVTLTSGEEFVLKDGQRLTVPGAAMPPIE